MEHCSRRIGDAYFRTPRDTIRGFVQLLSILDQNPGASWSDLIGEVRIELGSNPDLQPLDDTDSDDDDELSSFSL